MFFPINFSLDLFALAASFSVDFLDVLQHRFLVALKLSCRPQRRLWAARPQRLL
jgi:hypothetical protein